MVTYKVTSLYLHMPISNLVTLFSVLTLINYFIILGISAFYFFFYFSKFDKVFYSVLFWSAIIALTVISDRIGLLVFDRTSQAYLILTIFNYLLICYILIPLINGGRKLTNLVKQTLLNQAIIKQFYNLVFEGILIGLKPNDVNQDADFVLVDCNLAFCRLLDKSRADIVDNPKDVFDSETTKRLIEITKNKIYTSVTGYVKTRSEQLIPVKIVAQYFTVKSLHYFCLSVIDTTDEYIVKKIKSQNKDNLEKQFSLLDKKDLLVKELVSKLEQLGISELASSELQDLVLKTESEPDDSILSNLSKLEVNKQTTDEDELEKELFSKFTENSFSELVPSLGKLSSVKVKLSM